MGAIAVSEGSTLTGRQLSIVPARLKAFLAPSAHISDETKCKTTLSHHMYVNVKAFIGLPSLVNSTKAKRRIVFGLPQMRISTILHTKRISDDY